MVSDPGTNWSYAHTNFMTLARSSRNRRKTVGRALKGEGLDPMGLKTPPASETSEMPTPILHAYDSERRAALKIPADLPFYEEATFFNAQWGHRWSE